MRTANPIARRKKVLFICGSRNQTTQMTSIAADMPEVDAWFTPYFVSGAGEVLRRLKLLEMSIAGDLHAGRAFEHLREANLKIDYRGLSVGNHYDLIVTCTDQVVPANVWGRPLVVCQEGILDPPNFLMGVAKRFPKFPMFLAGTAATGLSKAYDRFCVGSEGYLEDFEKNGISRDKMVVTGIANFDNCERYYENDFPYRDYVLVCTSDARETFKREDRPAFIRHCRDIAKGRRMVFKLHPNEKYERAKAEIETHAPGALIYREGCAEEMVANCSVLVCQWSTLVFVGAALGKELHSFHNLEDVKRLVPVQNKRAAKNIAEICQQVLAERAEVVSVRPNSDAIDPNGVPNS